MEEEPQKEGQVHQGMLERWGVIIQHTDDGLKPSAGRWGDYLMITDCSELHGETFCLDSWTVSNSEGTGWSAPKKA